MACLFWQRFDFNIGQPNLCLIFNSKKMKRIILVSCYIIACVAMVSCSNDEVGTTPNNNKQQISADADSDPIDGQSGQTPISPPKP